MYLLSLGLLSVKEDVKNNSFIYCVGLFSIINSTREVDNVFLIISNVKIFSQHNVKTIFTRDLVL